MRDSLFRSRDVFRFFRTARHRPKLEVGRDETFGSLAGTHSPVTTSKGERTVRTQLTCASIALLASAAAHADGRFTNERAGARGPAAAAFYVAVPIGARDRQQARPTFGLRVQELPLSSLSAISRGEGRQAKTILDVPLGVRNDDALRDSGAAMLLGKGLIVGIVVGAVVAVSVISDDDDDDGGGY
jgi:hypothetical protein